MLEYPFAAARVIITKDWNWNSHATNWRFLWQSSQGSEMGVGLGGDGKLSKLHQLLLFGLRYLS
jgi:hypothetical protein